MILLYYVVLKEKKVKDKFVPNNIYLENLVYMLVMLKPIFKRVV